MTDRPTTLEALAAGHPVAERHRKLLESARRVHREWDLWGPELRNFGTRQVHEAIAEMADLVAEIDQAEADHA